MSKYASSVKNSDEIVPTKFVLPKSDSYKVSSYTRKLIPKNYLDEEKENAWDQIINDYCIYDYIILFLFWINKF